MHIDSGESSMQEHNGNRSHRRLWQRIKDLLKSCIGSHCNVDLFDRDGRLIDSHRLRQSIFDDEKVSERQRKTTWPYLLHIHSSSMTNKDKETFRLHVTTRYIKLKRAWQERISRGDTFYVTLADTILKDVRRTDRHVKALKKKKRVMFNVMMTYSVYHPHPGYSQGMTDMLSPLLYVLVDESVTYVGFCSLMNRYMAPLFDRDQIEIDRRLCLFDTLLRTIDFELWNKMRSETNDLLFVYRWLLLDCKREFYRFADVLRVLELVWICSLPSFSSHLSNNDRCLFTLFLSISILQEDRHLILSFSNEEDLHKHFFSSSSSRIHRSTRRILQRTQFYYSHYISLNK